MMKMAATSIAISVTSSMMTTVTLVVVGFGSRWQLSLLLTSTWHEKVARSSFALAARSRTLRRTQLFCIPAFTSPGLTPDHSLQNQGLGSSGSGFRDLVFRVYVSFRLRCVWLDMLSS